MSTTQMMRQTLEMPDQISAAESKLVYLFVSTADGATIDELQTSLDIQKISLFPVLDTLSSRGLIDRIDGQYVAA